MLDRDEDRGARRRALKRAVLGKPGSLRRWLIGSIVWLGACTLFAMVTGNPVVMFVAVLVDATAFVARSLLVGDEDEFNAELYRSMRSVARDGLPEDEMLSSRAAEEWLVRERNRAEGAPLPPSAEDDPASGYRG